NEEIYTMDTNGANQTNITNNAASDTRVAFSPDGSKIAFMTDRDGNFEIYVMSPDGTGPTNLTNVLSRDAEPSWQTLLSCTPPPPNGVAWYRAEGNADDNLGTNNGILQNGATFAPGFDGQAFSFDGFDDYVQVPDQPQLDVPQFTLEAWVNPNSLRSAPGGNAILTKGSAAVGPLGNSDDSYLLALIDGK